MTDSMALESLENFRAIPGTRLYRSATPENLTENDISTLKSMGIKHIFDARYEAELKRFHKNPVSKAFTLCKVEREGREIQYDLDKKQQNVAVHSEVNMYYLFGMHGKNAAKGIFLKRVPWYAKLWLLLLTVFDKIFKTMYAARALGDVLTKKLEIGHALADMSELFQERICTGGLLGQKGDDMFISSYEEGVRAIFNFLISISGSKV
jgi:hypothetical protein